MSNNPLSPGPRDSGIDFGVDSIAPPPGPPPPKVPKGWLARWDPNYKTFYYVNLATKQSQWEPPSEDAGSSSSSSKPPQSNASVDLTSDRPPYNESGCPKFIEPNNNYDTRPMSSNSAPHTPQPSQNSGPDYLRAPSPNRSRSHSLGSKISKFLKSRSASPMISGSQSGRPYYTPPPSQYYGVAHPQQMYHAPMVGAPMMMGGGGRMMGSHIGGRRRGGGIGPGGMMGLGLGGGLLGGMLLSDAIHDNEMEAYQEGFGDGADYDGGDFDGGGDFGDFGDF